ncbi:MAG: hypothetical protein KAY37_00985 [Phycisphaerae bacterium]|nr:hypothetical protein [Phycisphaerae bacterium]
MILNGWKTYLGMIGLGLLGICWSQGWISDDLAKTIGAILTTVTGVGFAHKADKIARAAQK